MAQKKPADKTSSKPSAAAKEKKAPSKVRKEREHYTFGKVDVFLLLTMVIIIGFGLIMLYSVSSYEAQTLLGDPAWYVKKQLISCVVGFAAMAVLAVIPYTFWQKKITVALYLLSLASVLLVKTSLGYEAHGARRWIRIRSGFTLQPAELVKIGVILMMALFITLYQKKMDNLLVYTVAFMICAAGAGLVAVVTDDLGTSMVIFAIGFVMLIIAEPKKRYLAVTLLLLIGAVVILILSKDFRRTRILAWIHLEEYADSISYQPIQALYAIGSGGFFGKGIGKSTQKMGFIPESQNDMIFSIICEELGIVGAAVLIILFIVLIWRFVVIYRSTGTFFGKMLVAGVMGHIGSQVILNLAVVTSLVPNTGVPLPFISYGRSSVIILMAEMGLVFSVNRIETRVRIEKKNREKVQTEVIRFSP